MIFANRAVVSVPRVFLICPHKHPTKVRPLLGAATSRAGGGKRPVRVRTSARRLGEPARIFVSTVMLPVCITSDQRWRPLETLHVIPKPSYTTCVCRARQTAPRARSPKRIRLQCQQGYISLFTSTTTSLLDGNLNVLLPRQGNLGHGLLVLFLQESRTVNTSSIQASSC